MTPFAETVTKILSLFVVASDVVILVIIAALIIPRLTDRIRPLRRVLSFLGEYAIELSFLVVLAATASSLYYSDIVGLKPCILCWWQRVFMYPQVLLLGLALWKNDDHIGPYSILLSAVGGIIAAYHTYLQFGGSLLIPCSTSEYTSPCSQQYFIEFGYVTIPTMALTVFLLVILLMLLKNTVSKQQSYQPDYEYHKI